MQGLSAIEGLLYDDARPITGTDEDARYRCKLALLHGANRRTRWRATCGGMGR